MNGCGSGGAGPKRSATEPTTKSRPTLRIAQFNHFVPAFDAWFDNEYAPAWGQRNGVEVIVDHLPQADLPSRAAAEVAAGAGHDIFSLLNGAGGLEDQVIDHQPIVEEVQAKVGPVSREADRATFNPKTKKRFAFPDYLAAWPVSRACPCPGGMSGAPAGDRACLPRRPARPARRPPAAGPLP